MVAPSRQTYSKLPANGIHSVSAGACDENPRQGCSTHLYEEGVEAPGSPDASTTDGLRSCRAALKELGNTEKQEVGRWANNRSRTAPVVPTKGACDAQHQANEGATEVRLGARQHPQPLQPRTPPYRPPTQQETPLCRPGRVADPRQLSPCPQRSACIVQSAGRVRLAAPHAVMPAIGNVDAGPPRH